MFKIFITISALALTLQTQSSWATSTPPPIKFSKLGEWVAFPVPQDELLQRFTQNAELILTPRDKTSDEAPNVLVHSKAQAEPLTTKEEFKKVLIDELAQKISINYESIFERNGERRYILELQSSVGTESMLSTLIMAELVGGRLYVFTYENYHTPFQQNVRSIRKLFQDMEIKPAS